MKMRPHGFLSYFLIFFGIIGFLIASDQNKDFLKFVLTFDFNYIGNILLDKWNYVNSIDMTNEFKKVNADDSISILTFVVFFLATFKTILTLPTIIFYLLSKYVRAEGEVLNKLRRTFEGVIYMKLIGLFLIFVAPTISVYLNSTI
jgi:hypothetical protein